jgi:hypothetical protein
MIEVMRAKGCHSEAPSLRLFTRIDHDCTISHSDRAVLCETQRLTFPSGSLTTRGDPSVVGGYSVFGKSFFLGYLWVAPMPYELNSDSDTSTANGQENLG